MFRRVLGSFRTLAVRHRVRCAGSGAFSDDQCALFERRRLLVEPACEMSDQKLPPVEAEAVCRKDGEGQPAEGKAAPAKPDAAKPSAFAFLGPIQKLFSKK